ncbi:MAG: hypothetical protein QM711_12020 [Micropruina sp.]|uniref:hypothetical protein n=1 Tax=Micropruina sp. TaxID=2737536 RepID=UPI0039E24A17
MTDQNSVTCAYLADPAVVEIAAALPSEVAEAFLLVAGHAAAEQPDADLRAARAHLRVAVTRPMVFRVRPGSALRVSLLLAGHLRGRPAGWAREAMAGLVASATTRPGAEGRRALIAAAAALERGLAESAGTAGAAA